jgi:serine/threonine protein kinase
VFDELDLLIRKRGDRARVEDYLENHPAPVPTDDEIWSWVEAEASSRVRAEVNPELPENVIADLLGRFPGLLGPDRLDQLDRDARKATPPAPEGYRMIGLIARGGFGAVYRAKSLKLEQDHAIKVFSIAGMAAEQTQKIRAEAVQMANLRHPNIVRVYDYFTANGYVYIVMELLPGGNLTRRIGAGTRPLVTALDEVRQIALAVQHGHDHGVIHNDLKLDNILLDESGAPKVTDYGLHYAVDPGRETLGTDGELAGTFHSMSPEKAAAALGRQPPGEIASKPYLVDVFGLGAILYHLLTGRPLYSEKTPLEFLLSAYEARYAEPRAVDKDIPPDVDAALKKALARDPAKRYSSAGLFAAEITKLSKKYGSPRRPWALVFLLLIIAVLGGTGLLAFAVWRPNVVVSALPKPEKDSHRDERSPAAGARQAPRLLVREMSIQHVANLPDRDELVGNFGESSFGARLHDGYRLTAELSSKAYCYLITFQPDGTDKICIPADEKTVPTDAASLAYPANRANLRELDDGAGLQVFFLLASSKPLPAYSEWKQRKLAGPKPWPWSKTPGQPDVVWRYHDGELVSFTRDRPFIPGNREVARGVERTIRGGGGKMAELGEWLRDGSDFEAIDGIGFTVRLR